MGTVFRPPRGTPVETVPIGGARPGEPTRAREGGSTPVIEKSRPFSTTVSRLQSLGLGESAAQHLHGITESGYNPDNVSSAKRLFEHSKQDLLVEKKRSVDPVWDNLTARQQRNVRNFLYEGGDLTALQSPEERLAANRISEYWGYVREQTGAEFDHTDIPRGTGPWTVDIRPTSSSVELPAGFQNGRSFNSQSEANDYAELMERTLNRGRAQAVFNAEVHGPIDLSDLRTPGTAPAPPFISFQGDFPAHMSPADGILQAGNKLLSNRYEQQIQKPVDALRRDVQMRPDMTPEQFALIDDQIRRDIYGMKGSSGMQREILRRFPRLGPAIGDSLLMIQHAMQLTSPSENINRKAENIVQILPETGDYKTYAKVEAALLTPQGRQWIGAVQDAMAVNRQIVDPRMEDPSQSGLGRAARKVQNVVMAGHQFGSEEGIKTGVGNAYEYYAKHGFSPDLLIKYDANTFRDAFPQLSTREAWNRVLSNVDAIEQQAWADYQADPAAGAYSDLKHQRISDYLTETLGADAFEYPADGNWQGRGVDMSTLMDQGMVPWGGHAMNGAQMFLIKNTYLRWPGYQLNVETYAPNATRYMMPYMNPRTRHAEHVYSMLEKLVTGRDNQIDPGMREALVQQAMTGMAAMDRLPAAYWFVNRAIASGGRLPLNLVNRGIDTVSIVGGKAFGANIDDTPIDLTWLSEKLGPDMATLAYHGALASAFGVEFSGGDTGLIPGERRSGFFGMSPDELHDNMIMIMAEWLWDMTVGSAVPAALAEATVRTWESENRLAAIGQQFGIIRTPTNVIKALSGQPVTDRQGLNPLEREFKPPSIRSAGEPLPEGSPPGIPIPLTQRFKDLTPAVRVYFLNAAEDAYNRMKAIDPKFATTQHEKDIETLTTPGLIQASSLEHLIPRHEKKEVFGYRAITQSDFQQKRRDVFAREPTPISAATGSPPLDAILRARTNFERHVVIDTENAARMYLRGESPSYPGYEGFLSEKQLLTPGTQAVTMDKDTAMDVAISYINAFAGKELPKDKLEQLGEAGIYGPQHGIVHKYADLIMNTYNREIERSRGTIVR